MAFINISNKNKNGVLKQIDRQDYLGLHSCSRLELYSFALALGYKKGYPSDLEGGKDSFVREEYTQHNTIRHAYSAVFFKENEETNKQEIEEIANTDKVFALTDRYANTGFSAIEDYMKQYDSLPLAMKLIAEIDEMYEDYINDKK